MTNHVESDTSSPSQTPAAAPSGWLKLGIIAATSAVAGGVAAAWWYRNTLKKLRQAGEKPVNSQNGISGDDSTDES
jgi:hypothetical protein